MDEDQNKGSRPEQQDAARPADTTHNIDDINVWGIVRFGVGLVIIGIVAYIGLYGLLKVFERQRQASEAPPPLMARGAEDRLPPQPRLQMMPGSGSEFKAADYEMSTMLDEEERALDSYGWVNKDAGIVRIPIEEAMKRVLEKGLPTRPPAAQAGTEFGPGQSTSAGQGR